MAHFGPCGQNPVRERVEELQQVADAEQAFAPLLLWVADARDADGLPNGAVEQSAPSRSQCKHQLHLRLSVE